jgi:NAD(P)-dependent dehydrogenase (short-subunit alcohol dehydrogenase family)
MGAYNAAKAAMASFTMTLQLELEGSDIRIIDVQPGDISTGFNDVIAKTELDDLYTARVDKTWRAVDRNMKAAPKPELVAGRIAKLIDAGNPPPRVTVGDTFQSIIAPIIFRFLPQPVRVWGLKKYYGL